MSNKNEIPTPYDIEGLTSFAKRHLVKALLMLVVEVLVLVLSTLTIIFYGSYLPVFIIALIAACAAVVLCGRLIKDFSFSDFSMACGEISDVHKEIRTHTTTKVGGINLFGVRKYDQDGKNEIRIGVFISEGEGVKGYFLNDVNEDHVDYYETKGEAIHIWGTRFPVKLEIDTDKWLCPVCGEFNTSEEKSCVRCERKILK